MQQEQWYNPPNEEDFAQHDSEPVDEAPRTPGWPNFEAIKEESAEQNPFDEFPPEVQEDVNGLIWLGHLEDDFEFCGHNFHIRTLKGDEELYASLVAKDFSGSQGEFRAYAWANIGLALIAVDGDPEFCPPVGPNREAYARARFNWVTSRWFWPLAEYIFNRYLALLERQIRAIQAIQDLSLRSLPTSLPFADSLTAPGTSSEAPKAG